VQYVALRLRPSAQSELGSWLEASPRFRAFLAAHQDKVRKKLTSSDDEETRLDVRAELLVAHLLLAERRFEVSFEAYGARQLGPDLSVAFRTNQRFNLEVTRIRATGEADPVRLASVIAGKLRQLPAEVPNGLVVVTRGMLFTERAIADATRALKTHAESMDEAFFARRGGLSTAREVNVRYARLSGVFAIDEAVAPPGVGAWANPEARHKLPRDIVAALTACLSAYSPVDATSGP